MFAAIDHGTSGLVFAYALAGVGVLVGLRSARAPLRRFLRSPLFALATLLGVGILWGFIVWAAAGFFAHLSRTVTELLGMIFLFAASAVAGKSWAHERSAAQHQRGTRLLDDTDKRSPAARPEAELIFGGYPVPVMDETKHFKVLGTTGTGKSTVIRQLLKGALARGDRAVIADPDGSYAEAFYDPRRGDVILNPFHELAARWDLFAEVIQPHDADQLARSLIPDHQGPDRNWRQYACTFLTAVLRQLHRVNECDPAKLFYLLTLASVEELRELLEGTSAQPFLARDNGTYFDSVRSVAMTHLTAIEHVARQKSDRAVSVRQWIREGRGALFLPYKAGELAALRQIISTWMRLAIFETMNGQPSDRRLWFVIDELDALGAIDGLKDALARLRKFGGCCVIGFQSIAQVSGIYGHADAQTIIENCGNTLILRCSSSEQGGTTAYASRLIGKREIIRLQTSLSQPARWLGGLRRTRTVSEQHTTEDAVMGSEIEQLADLTGFLKVASEPHWHRVVIPPPS